MKHISLIILLLFYFSFEAFSCSCKIGGYKESQEIDFELSDLVFLGEVITVEETSYKFQLIEIFKGDSNMKIIEGMLFTSCSMIPRKGEGQWLVYGNLTNGKLDISQCGVTRSYAKPHLIMVSDYTPPLGLHSKNYQEHINMLVKKGQKDWKEEVKMLKTKKR